MTERELPPCVYVVEATVDPAHEAEVSAWYEDIHIPELLSFPGIVAVHVADDGAGGRRTVFGPAA